MNATRSAPFPGANAKVNFTPEQEVIARARFWVDREMSEEARVILDTTTGRCADRMDSMAGNS